MCYFKQVHDTSHDGTESAKVMGPNVAVEMAHGLGEAGVNLKSIITSDESGPWIKIRKYPVNPQFTSI